MFYSIDNGRTYTTIVIGVPSSETSYVWTVPSVNSDSCKIKIIAYGPGWQYDESDGVFRITTTGVEEIASYSLAKKFGLKVFPNPARSQAIISYSIPPSPTSSPVKGEGFPKVSLQLYDISGRLLKTLVDENKNLGIYKITLNTKTLSAGIYFLSLQTQNKRLIERLVIVK